MLRIAIFLLNVFARDFSHSLLAEASSDYVMYDDVIYNDRLERLRRASGSCQGELPAPEEGSHDRVYPTSVRVSWSDVDGAEWYEIRVKSPELECVRGEKADLNGTSLIFRDLDAGTSYIVEVIAHNVNGCSEPREITFQTSPGSWKCQGSSEVPAGVIGLDIPGYNLTSSQALITWHPTPKALFYQVEIDPADPRVEGVGFIEEESTLIRGLSPGYSYKVTVTTVNGEQTGPVVERELITRLDRPENLEISNVSSNMFKVQWDVSQYATYYIVQLYGFDKVDDTYEINKKNITDMSAHFNELRPATKYKITLQAFNERASSPLISIQEYFTKLPSTSNITIKNVTEQTVYAQWEPVPGALQYRLILRDFNNQQVVKYYENGKRQYMNFVVDGVGHLLEHLMSAKMYLLQIFALNDNTDSLAQEIEFLTRLEQIQLLNVDKASVQDTSFIVRWEVIRGAVWYDVAVKPLNPNLSGNGTVYGAFTKLSNLTPGTLYKIVVNARNSKVYDSDSLPTTVEQFTRLSQPLNLTATDQDTTNGSMRLSWSRVPSATSYLLLVYDCSGVGRTERKGQIMSTTSAAPTTLSTKYKSVSKYWTYRHEKVKLPHLQCDLDFDDIERALKEGESQLPSTVIGQGRVTSNEVNLSNMLPATEYEIVVVSGSSEVRSNPSLMKKFTKLNTPQGFKFIPASVNAYSLALSWDKVKSSLYYQLDVAYTPLPDAKVRGLKNSIFVRSVNVTENFLTLLRLEPTTNYTFTLTARNKNTQSFSVQTTVFTLLSSPPLLEVVPDKLTTNSMLVQWSLVDKAGYYNVTFVAKSTRMKRQISHFRNVTIPEITLDQLTPNTYYEISIEARNRYTHSVPRKTRSFTELPTPIDFVVADVTESTILLTWSDVEGRKDFRLAIKPYVDDSSPPERFDEIANEPRKLFENRIDNQAYHIWMFASNPNTKSRVSELVVYTKMAQPQRFLFSDVSDKKLKLDWRPVPGADVYSLVIMPIYGQSSPNASLVPPDLLDHVIDVGNLSLTRRRRGSPMGRFRTKRVRREETEVDSESGRFIKCKELGENPVENDVFAQSDGGYYVNVTSSSLMLTRLEPGTKYKVILQALNENTDSIPVNIQTFTELEKPISVDITSLLNNSLQLVWLPVTKATYYEVSIFPENRFGVSSRPTIANTRSTDVAIKRLVPNTKYTISVVASNNHVRSSKNVVRVITKLSAVGNLRVTQLSVKHDRFFIQWDPVAHAAHYDIIVQSYARGYNISIENGQTQTTLSGLEDGTRYKVTVISKNDRTSGVEKTIYQFTKLFQPEKIEIVNTSITSSKFTVRWTSVRKANRYKVRIKRGDQEEERVIFADELQAVVGNLSSGQAYSVTVIAQNTKDKTYSDPVTVSCFTKLANPQNFSIPYHGVTDTSILVTWLPVPLATKYVVRVGVEHREGDHHRVFSRLEKLEQVVEKNSASFDGLYPASNYLLQLKAINDDTESFVVSFYEFTKLTPPDSITQLGHFFMDTEAILEWQEVKEADHYELRIYEVIANQSGDVTMLDDDGGTQSELDYEAEHINQIVQTNVSENATTRLVDPVKVLDQPYHKVTGLLPESMYIASVVAVNQDTESDSVMFQFETKPPCPKDYHLFPGTHLTGTLYRHKVKVHNATSCLELCCIWREGFECRSISLHLDSSICYLFAEDRILAPPLSIDKNYDHYERKFWREVSGFQIRSVTHNNVATLNETVELTLTFVYLGKTACVKWDFDDGEFAYYAVNDANCSHLCDGEDDMACTIMPTSPHDNENQIVAWHSYDIHKIYTVVVNVSDGPAYEVKRLKVAINERGCTYPTITIEDDGKTHKDPKKIYRSGKLLLSATPAIECKNFPGVDFDWKALNYRGVKDLQVTGSVSLSSLGSEILIPPLTFPVGFYQVSVSVAYKDDLRDLKDSDSIYILVQPSPLVVKIRGGSMRTVGARQIVTWDSSSVSYDPDVEGENRRGLKFTWFCRNYTDDKMLPFTSGSCFPDMNALTFSNPGIFSLNTGLMHLYVEYEFQVTVAKGKRIQDFVQQIIVKEGDPPEFHVDCKENCKQKMNPTQALALQATCRNCRARRGPIYKWHLFMVMINATSMTTAAPSVPQVAASMKRTALDEVFDWEANTTTGSDSSILVLNKNALVGGREYILRINISMEGLDNRVYSFSDFRFRTNLPPRDGVCTTVSNNGNCISFTIYPGQHLSQARPRKQEANITIGECKDHCCLTREFMCVSLSYNVMTQQCWLFEHNRRSLKENLAYEPNVDYYERLFYRGDAVVKEVVFECRDWIDEGEQMAYPQKGDRAPKSTLTYKFMTIPHGNQTQGLLLYFGNVQKTPGVSMALGDLADNYSVSVIAQVCDVYGECAMSNIISLEIAPPNSTHIGDTLSGFTSGNASKLAILSNTGNSKAAAQLVQSISSIINIEHDESEELFGNFTSNVTSSLPYLTTASPTTAEPTTASAFYVNETGNSTLGIAKGAKINLRSDVVDALSVATTSVTSMDNIQQMTSAMNAITKRTDEISGDAQRKASGAVMQMAGSLSAFSEDTNKEEVTAAAGNIVGSLGSVAKASETDMSDLQSQMSKSNEINFGLLDEEDLSPDEFEYYKERKLLKEKRRVRRSALGSQDVVENAIQAMESTAGALLGKQMEGEPPVDVKSDKLEMKIEKTMPSDLGEKNFSTSSGASLKLPSAEAILGKNATNETDSVDMQVTAFNDNPFGFGEDAAFINSPVTMLKIGSSNGPLLGNDKSHDKTDAGSNEGVGISIPSKFDPMRDMITVVRNINDTSLSISKFEVLSKNNAILVIVEPEDDRAKFEVYLRHGSKPSEEDYDFRFDLPHNIWDVDDKEDLYKIFISEEDIKETGLFFIGIKDLLNVSRSLESSSGRVRRRRSILKVNSTTYHLLIAAPGCRRFDQEAKAWTGDGCKVDQRSTPEVTECLCTKLSPTSIFSAEFFVPPNTINFATVFAKINIADNPAVFSTVISFICVYLLMLVWARRADQTDAKKWSLKSCIDNRKDDRYLYQISIFTGHGRRSATHSKVSCVIFGEQGKSRVRRLAIREDQVPYTPSSVVHVLLREPKALGTLTHIHIWHDNKGKGENRSWYLDQIVFQEVRTGKRYFFICDQWLAVDHDDGKVDRIVPVATADNMSTFHRLFVSTTAQKFTEDHLWISLFYRPTKSNFTRCQRLSCCMALLFMTMIANAMFFESGNKVDKAGTRTLKVGPFTLSPLQLWTSFCSTLLVVPVTTIVMTLFKKAKTKQQEEIDKTEKAAVQKAVRKFNAKQNTHAKAETLPQPWDIAGCDAVYKINLDGTINAKPNIATKDESQPPASQWPHYCVYIAWTLTWIAVLVSGFFAILYSFEWGRPKAERWLSNMMLSFWQSVLIVQPIKVILLAMFIATIVKKPDHQALDSVDHREVKEVERNFINLCKDNIASDVQEEENLSPPKPPSKRKLRRARRLREKEKAMSGILFEVVTYFFYIMVLLFLCHGNRDVKGLRITQQMKSTFFQPKFGFDSVTSVDYFWRFANEILLPSIYPTHWYNGDKKNWRNRHFLTDEQSYRVGPARLRQLRVQEHKCPLVGTATKNCRGHFDFNHEETRDFLPGWRSFSDRPSNYSDDDLIDDPTVIAWQYQSGFELRGVPFIGDLSVYPGGGYSAELGVNFESGKFVLSSLFNHSWIDHQTRAVFAEFTVYNPNINLFTSVQLLTEFPPVGAAVTYTSILTFRLYQYLGAYGNFRHSPPGFNFLNHSSSGEAAL
ncbi:uncharacterized protein LOC143465242 isoform X4 [Clavelina lepadiformis]|uniref:uncharacterized protein LOC143465242 isoform X4 n=1 Tax=Clavelina lepadiformis TaxID=159417 RepID=UPI0040416527